ncbi:peroxiredoxin family protein [Mongoliitalea daihaiensis]|uniref:peroxiredoxin family protein n=1 Tax=Mongoliitalea daihaiensis TaxID=2782006 RepID=UPI001F3CC061|nr:TlpA disulfide reductase family protein [Mongoliitalea daihaiensis]
MELLISPDVIPFLLTFQESGEKWEAFVKNDRDILHFEEIVIKNDSIFIEMGVFDSVLKLKLDESNTLSGGFVKNFVPDYFIPLQGSQEFTSRFPVVEQPRIDFSGRWKIRFTKSDGDGYDAIGLFEQTGDQIRGTFLTPLGDYRFLEGNVSGDELYMSTFDGSHAFLFRATLSTEGELIGSFRSGPRYQESFIGERNETFELPDAYSMNYLKEGFDRIQFAFPDVDGNMVSSEDPRFKDKLVLIQLFGTWCPNCVDETRFLAPWYERNKDKGIEIIGLAFESKADFTYASERVKKTIDRLQANYTFLIAGSSNKEEASKALPALNQVIAFPTLIYLDKTGAVRKIHTGFNGPGTGAYYERWIEEHETFIRELLNE